jgi:hypothetical protein
MTRPTPATGRVVRVFPRRTNATPTDELAYVGLPHMWTEADEVHISVTFTRDLPMAEALEREWRHVAPTKIGGPALDDPGAEFTPGMYLRDGYTITSRGCPNHCWFCDAWKREGNTVRELPICDGWNVLDSNLLTCSEGHIRAVFAMLARQDRRPEFTGGIEAARLKPWHVEAITALRPRQLFLAYDTPDDLEPLRAAGAMFAAAGWTRAGHKLRAYVLVGYPGDTQDAARGRMRQAWASGCWPMGMLYQDHKGRTSPGWKAKPFADVHEVGKMLIEVTP